MHTPRKPETAARLLSAGQMMVAALLLLLAIAVAAAFGPVLLLKAAVGLAIAFYIEGYSQTQTKLNELTTCGAPK